MSFQPCWRCLLRASDLSVSIQQLSSARISPSAAPFSTSTYSLAKPQINAAPVFRGKRLTLKKAKPKTDVRRNRPAPGERKAYRKRIVLSNTNALPVHGMEDLTVENMCKQESRGMVLGIPGDTVDQLRAVGAFKPTQAWGMFRRPGMLVRNETVEYAKLLEELQSQGKSLRRVLVGERGSGKSLMALQAMTMAFLRGWTIINIPEAQELTIGHFDYAPLPGSSPLIFIQKTFTAKILSQISSANPHLENLQLSSSTPPPNFPIPIPANISLARLAGLGASDPEIAWPVFQLLISELTLPNTHISEDAQKRPPLLFALDSLAHAMQDNTAYRTPSFKPIHAHDLALVKTFMDYLTGASPLPNGGLVLAATSASNPPPNPSLDLALAKLEAGSASDSSAQSMDLYNPSPATPNPFFAYDKRVMDIFEGPHDRVEVQRLHGLSKEEAKGLMEYWARSGILRQNVDERLVGEKWSLSGGGIVGELERGCVGMRI
ncbi:MAG: hypothetical protein Q9195_006206 [Heterodermia aff. obscurata]